MAAQTDRLETKPEIQTFVFFDLEATGLASFGEKPPRITEICLLSVQREELLTREGTPRVINKVTLCVDPQRRIHPRASDITGLHNDALETQSPLNSAVVDILSSFLLRLPQPVCLIAHYGNGFDFKLVATEMKRIGHYLPDCVLCADSYDAFKSLDMNHDTANEGALNLGQSSSESSNNTTPQGQHTDVNGACKDMKQVVRQMKRKAEYDKYIVDPKAKQVRKRLFDSSASENEPAVLVSGQESSRLDEKSAVFGDHSANISNNVKQQSLSSETDKIKTAEDKSSLEEIANKDDVVMCAEEKSDEHKICAEEILDKDKICTEDIPDKNKMCTEDIPDKDKGCSEDIFHKDKCAENRGMFMLDSQESVTEDMLVAAVTIIENGANNQLSKSSEGSNTAQGDTTVQSIEKLTDVVTPLQAHQRPSESSTPETVRKSSSGGAGNCQASDMTIQAMDLTTPNSKSPPPNFIPPSQPVTPDTKINKTNAETPISRPWVSYKLVEIYRRTFGVSPPVSHAAEDDCVTLMKVVKKKCPQFLHWVGEHAVPLKNIDPF